MSLKSNQKIQPLTAELAALDQFKKSLNLLLENYSKYFDDLLSGEQSLPFGLLVYFQLSPFADLDFEKFVIMISRKL